MTRVRAIHDGNNQMSKANNRPPIAVMTVLTVTMTQTDESGRAEIIMADGGGKHFVAPLNDEECKSLMLSLVAAISRSGAKS